MKKYLCALSLGLVVLTACGDDETPVALELNKLTSVACQKEGEDVPLFSADINYTTEGKIASIRFAGGENLLFIYSDSKLTVTGTEGEYTAEYTLAGDVITSKRISKENPYISNEIYVSDEYNYVYSGSSLTQSAWTTRWPKPGEGGYELRSYAPYEQYRWEGGNVTLYAQAQDKREIRYEYSSVETPANFPFRVIGSFDAVSFDAVSPLNLLYGDRNRSLPSRAYVYAVPDASQVEAEYTYSYTTVGDYITAMTVTDGSDTYTYTFAYNYAVNQ